MRSPVARTVLRLTGALAVLVVSFWATLKLLDYWSTPPTPLDPNGEVIEVVEATYGKNCQDAKSPGYPNLVKPGNATAAVAKVCDNAKGSCQYLVELAKAADPAPGCAKDFLVSWRCGGDPTPHLFHLAAEANSKTALLSCPAP